MRGGKSITALALAFFVGWLLSPFWQWYLERALDRASKPHGVTIMVTNFLTAIAPVHQLLLGIALGMTLALIIGYWGRMGQMGRKALFSAGFFAMNARAYVDGIIQRSLLLDGVMTVFPPGEVSRRFVVSDSVRVAYATCLPPGEFLTTYDSATRTVCVKRIGYFADREFAVVEVNIWGRCRFFPPLRKWRELALSDDPITFSQATEVFCQLNEDIKAEAPLHQPLVGTGSETLP